MSEPDEIQIHRSILQITFDTAVNSMDFGSGFLDEEEIEALRAVAVALGVDPKVATPRNRRCPLYGHEWARNDKRWRSGLGVVDEVWWYCPNCNATRDEAP